MEARKTNGRMIVLLDPLCSTKPLLSGSVLKSVLDAINEIGPSTMVLIQLACKAAPVGLKCCDDLDATR